MSEDNNIEQVQPIELNPYVQDLQRYQLWYLAKSTALKLTWDTNALGLTDFKIVRNQTEFANLVANYIVGVVSDADLWSKERPLTDDERAQLQELFVNEESKQSSESIMTELLSNFEPESQGS